MFSKGKSYIILNVMKTLDDISSDKKEIERIIANHKNTGYQSEMNR